jgi:hypothetical protein
MTPKFHFEGVGEMPFSGVDFDCKKSAFVVSGGENKECHFLIEYPHSQGITPPEEGMVHLLFNPNHYESDVRSVHIPSIGSKTMGWLCTVSALISDAHSFSHKVHFRNAAYAAIQLLFQNGVHFKFPSIINGCTLDLTELVDEKVSVLIFHKPSLAGAVSPNICELFPSLHQHGFVPFHPEHALTWQPKSEAKGRFMAQTSKISLDILPRSDRFDDFIAQIFQDYLPAKSTSLHKFFLYYQLVEVLLEIIFVARQSDSITALVAVRDNPVFVHPVIEKLQDDAKEKKRMSLLFNEYTGLESKLGGLKMACNDVLRTFGAEEQVIAADALYCVRNMLFHNLRRMSPSTIPAVDGVLNHLEWVVPEMLIKFRYPNAIEYETNSIGCWCP